MTDQEHKSLSMKWIHPPIPNVLWDPPEPQKLTHYERTGIPKPHVLPSWSWDPTSPDQEIRPCSASNTRTFTCDVRSNKSSGSRDIR